MPFCAFRGAKGMVIIMKKENNASAGNFQFSERDSLYDYLPKLRPPNDGGAAREEANYLEPPMEGRGLSVRLHENAGEAAWLAAKEGCAGADECAARWSSVMHWMADNSGSLCD
jgi:hypothetical protein